MTPTRLEPIWVARRIRCASPPERRAGGAVEREVADADVLEEGEPLDDLAHDQPGDGALGVVHLQPPDPLAGRARREGAELGDAGCRPP